MSLLLHSHMAATLHQLCYFVVNLYTSASCDCTATTHSHQRTLHASVATAQLQLDIVVVVSAIVPPHLQHTKYTSNMLVVTSASASQAQTVKTQPFVTTTTLPTLPSSMPPRHANTHLSLLPITHLHQRNWPCPSPRVSLFPAPFYASCCISLTLGPCLVSQQQ